MAKVSDITLAFFFPSFVFLSVFSGECSILALMCVLFRTHRAQGCWLVNYLVQAQGKKYKEIVPPSPTCSSCQKGKMHLEITVQTRKEYKRGHWLLKLLQLNNTATKSFYRSLAHHNPFKSKCCPAKRNKGINFDHQLLCIHWCDFDTG